MLTITEMLRKHGVVGKFVEFYGEGVGAVPLANRATIGNMSPEFGSTCAIFPIDDETLDYLRLTGRTEAADRAGRGLRQGAGPVARPGSTSRSTPSTSSSTSSTVVPSIAGPKRPQDRVVLSRSPRQRFARRRSVRPYTGDAGASTVDGRRTRGETFAAAQDGAVVIASITSCTNTSNPSVMLGAALLAQEGRRARSDGASRGSRPRWRPAPRSSPTTTTGPGLQPYLDKLGFNLVGYGCTTCIGNSGPLPEPISAAVNDADLAVVSVLSGNRNFEGRINPDVKMNYLASPPLVVAYALPARWTSTSRTSRWATTTTARRCSCATSGPRRPRSRRRSRQSIGADDVPRALRRRVRGRRALAQRCRRRPGDIFEWDPESTYVRKPPYFDGMPRTPQAGHRHRRRARAGQAGRLGDHRPHLPAGSIKADSPAGRYLAEHGVDRKDFNSYGSRRGNHEVMIRGTFANIRLRNLLLDGVEGGFTVDLLDPAKPQTTIYDAVRDVPGRGRPARGARRQGVRLGLLARLGGQGHRAARRQGGHRRVLRAHPPFEPDRHGRAAAAVPGRERRPSRSASTGEETFTITGVTALTTARRPSTVDVDGHQGGRRP